MSECRFAGGSFAAAYFSLPVQDAVTQDIAPYLKQSFDLIESGEWVKFAETAN